MVSFMGNLRRAFPDFRALQGTSIQKRPFPRTPNDPSQLLLFSELWRPFPSCKPPKVISQLHIHKYRKGKSIKGNPPPQKTHATAKQQHNNHHITPLKKEVTINSNKKTVNMQQNMTVHDIFFKPCEGVRPTPPSQRVV